MSNKLERATYGYQDKSFSAYSWDGNLIGAQQIPGLIMLRSVSPLVANTPRIVSLSEIDYDLMPTSMFFEGTSDMITVLISVQKLLPTPTTIFSFFARSNNFTFPRCVLPTGCQITLNSSVGVPSAYLFFERADLLHLGTF